ncbi:MAG: DinB family protein [Cyclobacteriaceae bacterium]
MQTSDAIDQIRNIHSGQLWLGANFESKIEGIDDSNAFLSPQVELHSVAQVIAHLTAWNFDLIEKIKNGKGKLLDSDPSNWPSNTDLKLVGWDGLIKTYFQTIEEVIKNLSEKNSDFLSEEYYDQDFKKNAPYDFAVSGMIQHTIYHLGQLGIIIKILKSENNQSE